MRLGKPSAWGKAPLRLGGPSGQGKALWKTANRIGWDPIFDAAKLRQMVLGTKCRILYPRIRLLVLLSSKMLSNDRTQQAFLY